MLLTIMGLTKCDSGEREWENDTLRRNHKSKGDDISKSLVYLKDVKITR